MFSVDRIPVNSVLAAYQKHCFDDESDLGAAPPEHTAEGPLPQGAPSDLLSRLMDDVTHHCILGRHVLTTVINKVQQ